MMRQLLNPAVDATIRRADRCDCSARTAFESAKAGAVLDYSGREPASYHERLSTQKRLARLEYLPHLGCAIHSCSLFDSIHSAHARGETRSIHAQPCLYRITGDLAANYHCQPQQPTLHRYQSTARVQAFIPGHHSDALSLFVCSVGAILGAFSGRGLRGFGARAHDFYRNPLLGDMPADMGWVAIVLISAGVFLNSGEPLRESVKRPCNCRGRGRITPSGPLSQQASRSGYPRR